jgi:Rod binding domain-containing protein
VNGLTGIAPAGAAPDAGLRRAAQQLESVFLQQLLQRMNTVSFAGDDSDFAKSPAEEQFQQLLHGALAERAAGGVGIADLVYRQLSHQTRRTP